MKSWSGARLVQEISCDCLKGLYACDRRTKTRCRLIAGKLVQRFNYKYRLLAKKNHVCQLCKMKATHYYLATHDDKRYFIEVGFFKNNKFTPLTLDHIKPLSKGGSKGSLRNQQLLCQHCNCNVKNDKDHALK